MEVNAMFGAFNIIRILCYLNMTFLLQHIVTFIFTSKLKRFYQIPTLLHLTDTILFGSSIFISNWISNTLYSNVFDDSNLPTEVLNKRMVNNLRENIGFNLQYFFSVQITCLIVRLSMIFQYNDQVGPLIKIVGKMSRDFYNFFLLYLLLTLMFAIVGNINFLFDLRQYKNFFSSILTVIDASLGNYSFEIFENNVQRVELRNLGLVYTICIVLCFNIIVLNLIIAILANTYNIFDGKSNGLYLSKILMSRDELLFDPYYGSYLASMPPINFIQLFPLPIATFMRFKHPLLLKINDMVMKIQYVTFMLIFFSIFVVVSSVLTPIAYIVCTFDKIKTLGQQPNIGEQIKNNLLFFPLGMVILGLDLVADMYYFWVNSFRDGKEMKQIIIEKEKSVITHKSIREIQKNCIKYGIYNIKTVNTDTLVKTFNKQLKVIQNIQFLMFG